MLKNVNTRTMNAVRFVEVQLSSLWLVFGQITPWTTPYSDAAPPADNPNAAGINGPACAVLATPIWTYEDDVNGTLTYKDSLGVSRKFVQVGTSASAIADQLTQVLLTAEVTGAQLAAAGVTTFRQAAFYSNLVPAAGYTTGYSFLTAAQVANWGNIETIENSIPQGVLTLDVYDYAFVYQFVQILLIGILFLCSSVVYA